MNVVMSVMVVWCDCGDGGGNGGVGEILVVLTLWMRNLGVGCY